MPDNFDKRFKKSLVKTANQKSVNAKFNYKPAILKSRFRLKKITNNKK